MTGCECEVPKDKEDHQHPHRRPKSCVKCGKIIPEEWTSNDTTFEEFFQRLEEIYPGGPPSWFAVFKGICRARELRGREVFGHSHLARDNPGEAIEEAADGLLYAFFDILDSRRHREEEEWALALTAAHHFAQAYHALMLMHTGIPLPISDDEN